MVLASFTLVRFIIFIISAGLQGVGCGVGLLYRNSEFVFCNLDEILAIMKSFCRALRILLC